MFMLYRYHVASIDRRSFGSIGAENMHFIRLSIATSLEDLREVVARMGRAASDANGFAEFVKDGNHLY